MKRALLLITFLIISFSGNAQTSIGFETQVYPAGAITGLRFDLAITSNLNITSRLAYNVTDRRDWGEHENEEGEGPGFSLGIEKTDFLDIKNLSLNVRSDFWFLEIDWTDRPTGPALCGALPCPSRVGSTDIIVFQPTIGLAYSMPLSDKIFVKPAISFGYEINVKTEGEPVGEGAILLGGFHFGFRL